MPEAKQKLREARDRLSEADYLVGYFYYRQTLVPRSPSIDSSSCSKTIRSSRSRDAVYFYLARRADESQARSAKRCPCSRRLVKEFEQSEYLGRSPEADQRAQDPGPKQSIGRLSMRSCTLVLAAAFVVAAPACSSAQRRSESFTPLELAVGCAPPPTLSGPPSGAPHVVGSQDTVREAPVRRSRPARRRRRRENGRRSSASSSSFAAAEPLRDGRRRPRPRREHGRLGPRRRRQRRHGDRRRRSSVRRHHRRRLSRAVRRAGGAGQRRSRRSDRRARLRRDGPRRHRQRRSVVGGHRRLHADRSRQRTGADAGGSLLGLSRRRRQGAAARERRRRNRDQHRRFRVGDPHHQRARCGPQRRLRGVRK